MRTVDVHPAPNAPKKKWSYYNSIHKNDEQTSFFFNCRTKKILFLDNLLASLLQGELFDISTLSWRHPDLYSSLINNGFIVDRSCDEFELFCQEQVASELNSQSYEIIINPTLDCNLSCWYCYEKHIKGSRINERILQSIKRLIEDKIADHNIRYLSLSFFGGEPLIEFDSIVWDIIQSAFDFNKRYNKIIHLSFTTNATLLSKKVVDALTSTGFKISMQIPFDGGKSFHDKIKFSKYIPSAFEATIENIIYAARSGIKINVRCNYDDKTISSFDELISRLTDSDLSDNLRFSFQKIWQAQKNEQTENEKKRLMQKVRECSTSFSVDDIISTSPCYADVFNSVIINYNGDVFKCTARDFCANTKEGVLSEDGTIIFNERFHERMNRRFSNESCRKCKIFPICNMCSQQRLEHQDNLCIRGINDSQKNEYLLSIIRNMLR